ncbi:MAG: hypothetical protein J6T04_09425 [Bacteroidales bacterium]|nr:hypothetical protein [Bacteroidales bacterium]
MSAFLTYALDEKEELVYIEDVANGLKCRCHCPNPKCRGTLNAKNAGNIRNHHFAHANGHECKGAFESQLHLLAKEILQETGQIMLPSSDNEGFPSGLVKIHSIEVEKYDKCYDIKPDVEGVMENGERLLIEFRVSHRVTDNKRKTIINNNLKCIEIDINYQSLFKPDLKEFLVGSSRGRKWIVYEPSLPKEEGDTYSYPNRRNPLYNEVRDALKEIFDRGTLIIHPFYKVLARKDDSFDLRKYNYDVCEAESDYKGFKSDLLIYRSQQKDKGHISINIRGRKRSKSFEYPLGLRIIDVIVLSSAEIENIKSRLEQGNLVDSLYVKFYYIGFGNKQHNSTAFRETIKQQKFAEDSNKFSVDIEQENDMIRDARRWADEYAKSKQWQ